MHIKTLGCTAASRAFYDVHSRIQDLQGCGCHSCELVFCMNLELQEHADLHPRSPLQGVFLELGYKQLTSGEVYLAEHAFSVTSTRELLGILRQALHLGDTDNIARALQSVERFDTGITEADWAELSTHAFALHRHRLPSVVPRPTPTYAALIVDVLNDVVATIRLPLLSSPPYEPDPAAVQEACNVCKLVIVRGLFCTACSDVLILLPRNAAWRSGGACR